MVFITDTEARKLFEAGVCVIGTAAANTIALSDAEKQFAESPSSTTNLEHVLSHFSFEAKLFVFPSHPPKIKSLHELSSESKYQRRMDALHGPMSRGAKQSSAGQSNHR